MNDLLKIALKKGREAKRLSPEEAVALAEVCTPEELHLLGEAAYQNRISRFGRLATYVCNLQINPSNVCEGSCKFCKYRAEEGDEHAYVLEEDQIFDQIQKLAPTEVHIVGGMNQIWDFARNLDLVAEIHSQSHILQIFIKGFTAVEIDYFARQTQSSTESVLSRFKEAGLRGMPGGGAEIFSKRMRKKLCPDKLPPSAWLEIHRQAHKMGLITNGTVLFGAGERAGEIVEHLTAIRELQDATSGFSCFIPLAYQTSKDASPGPSTFETLRMVALCRLVLDNVPHIKAYWPMIGLETASMALSFGADDLDGTLGRERIAHAAGAPSPKALAQEQMRETIELGGFEPKERHGDFAPKDAEGC